MSLKSMKQIFDESPGDTFTEKIDLLLETERAAYARTKYNALSECRAAVNHQIEFLEREMGIEAAFPVTIGLLRVSQDLTRRMAALPICESPMEDGQPTKACQISGEACTKGNL